MKERETMKEKKEGDMNERKKKIEREKRMNE